MLANNKPEILFRAMTSRRIKNYILVRKTGSGRLEICANMIQQQLCNVLDIAKWNLRGQ